MDEIPKTAVAYYYGNDRWGLPEGRKLMGSNGNYTSGHYYVLYNSHFIINAVPYKAGNQ